jgi:hypothetical protein
MKKFCVANTSLFENTTEMTIVEAETEFDALCSVLTTNLEEVYEDITTVDGLKQLAYDCDTIIEALEL